MKKSFVKFRTQLLQWLVNFTAPIYLNLVKKNKAPWKYSKDDLANFPSGSLGKELFLFLEQRKFDLIPKAERHDIFHLLTGYDTTPEEETKMQFWLLGNGKWTPYTIGTCIIGFFLIPEYSKSFFAAYKKGCASISISDWRFEPLLYMNFNSIVQQIHQPLFLAFKK